VAIAMVDNPSTSTDNLISRSSIKDFKRITDNSTGLIQNVKIGAKLGAGNFGEVFKGRWNSVDVALKKLKTDEEVEGFFREAATLMSLNHPNIVQFLGIYIDSKDRAQYIVTEFMSLGALDTLLREKGEMSTEVLIDMAEQIVAGMLYLETKSIVHRDLALRNILVTMKGPEQYLVKVSDFGMSRSIESTYYKASDRTMPVRWCAPESLEYAKFSVKTDVWSLAIVFWELFTFGKIPYLALSNKEIMQSVLAGERLSKPNNCPDIIWECMMRCWSAKPDDRPSFNEIQLVLESFGHKASPPPSYVQPGIANYAVTDTSGFMGSPPPQYAPIDPKEETYQ